LEHHTHAFAQADEIGLGGVNVLAAQKDFALDARAVDQIVQAVQRSQQGRFTATRRTDEGRDRPVRNRDVNVLRAWKLP
jgi:hypothetical protein